MKCTFESQSVTCLDVELEEGEDPTLQEVLDQTEGVVFDPETQMVVSVDIGEPDLDAKVAPGTYYIVPKVMELAPVAEVKEPADAKDDPPPVTDAPVVEPEAVATDASGSAVMPAKDAPTPVENAEAAVGAETTDAPVQS